MYRPVPSRLFRNLGNGRFEDVTEAAGLDRFYGPALGVVCADLNGDGRTDIFVANDTAANHLWLNQGDGTFREAAIEAGVAYSGDGLAKAGMGVTVDDVENNGNQILLVTNLAGEGASVFRGDRTGQFEEVTAQYGLFQPTFSRTGFGAGWFDTDNDGRLDLFVANGGVTLTSFGVRGASPYAQSNQLFHNEGRGSPFRDVTDCGGEAFRLPAVSRAAAFGDIDNDGAIDIVVTNNNGPVRLLHNRAAVGRHWLIVRLEATHKNRFALGARVGLIRRGQDTLWRRAHTDSSYLSSNDPRVHFGLGERSNIDAMVVHWPNGSKEEFRGLRPDRIVTLKEGSGTRV
jgi:enediyne biosynthesis protein E4